MRRVANEPGSLRCLPASFEMAVSILEPEVRMSRRQADAATGFSEGRETWPYRMIEWFASRDYVIRHVDMISMTEFAVDPASAIRSTNIDQATLEYVLSITDIDRETRAIESALATGRVESVRAVPSVSDIREHLAAGWLALVTLDSATLWNADHGQYDVHMVLATGMTASSIVLQDSGPPAKWDFECTQDTMQRALVTPTPESGTCTYVKRQTSLGVLSP